MTRSIGGRDDGCADYAGTDGATADGDDSGGTDWRRTPAGGRVRSGG